MTWKYIIRLSFFTSKRDGMFLYIMLISFFILSWWFVVVRIWIYELIELVREGFELIGELEKEEFFNMWTLLDEFNEVLFVWLAIAVFTKVELFGLISWAIFSFFFLRSSMKLFSLKFCSKFINKAHVCFCIEFLFDFSICSWKEKIDITEANKAILALYNRTSSHIHCNREILIN